MQNQPIYRLPRHCTLAACLAAALGLASSATMAVPRQQAIHAAANGGAGIASVLPPAHLRVRAAKAKAENPNHPAAPHQVDNCNDGGPGSLRAVIGDPNTVSGDSIELTGMAMTCSRITLASAIHVTQDTLHIHGPGAAQLTIDGDHADRVFYHTGGGTLGISNVTIINGAYVDVGAGTHHGGGCIFSSKNVLLISSVVSHCLLEATGSTYTYGAGIYTGGYLTLSDSSVLANHGLTTSSNARIVGGGTFTNGDFAAVYSTIGDNYLTAINGDQAFGGGLYLKGNVYIAGSTISGNSSLHYGGIDIFGNVATAVVTNSTVSGNFSNAGSAGIYSNVATTIANSTIAFNKTDSNTSPAGVSLHNAALLLESSIIADNSRPDGESDLGGTGQVSNVSHNNLVVNHQLPMPLDTISGICPQLDVLGNNGGSTFTHGLNATSPAIDKGNQGNLVTDQRGAARVFPTNGLADIGSVEWQSNDKPERLLASGFDGACDL